MKYLKYLIILLIVIKTSLSHASSNSCSYLFSENLDFFSNQKQFYSHKEIKQDFDSYAKQIYATDPVLAEQLVNKSRLSQATAKSIEKIISILKQNKFIQFVFNKDHIKVTKEEYYQEMLTLSRKLFEAKLSKISDTESALQLPHSPNKQIDLMTEALIQHLQMNQEISLNAIFSGIQEFNPHIYRRSNFSMVLKSILTQNLSKFHLLELLQKDKRLQDLIETNNYDALRSYLKQRLQPVAYAEWAVSTSNAILNLSLVYLEFSVTYTVVRGEDLNQILPVFNIHLTKAANNETTDTVWNFASLLNYYSDLNQYSNSSQLTNIEQQYFNELRASGALTPLGQ